MRKFLLTYGDNWADEMDIDGCCILSEKELDKFNKSVENFTGGEFWIGTNESIEYDDKDSINGVYDIVEITPDEAKILKKLDLETMGFACNFYEFVINHSE
jgi:hypothetical protein